MVDTLDYFWRDISPQRAETLLLKEELPGRYLLRRDPGGDTIVSFVTNELQVKHYFVNQRGDSLLYKAQPALKASLLNTFIFMKEASQLQWLYPVNVDDGDDDVHGEGVEDGACRVCGLLNPSAHHMRNHRLVFCNKCDSMIATAVWSHHKCNQRQHHCEVCTYSTPRPDNLRRHMETKHRVNNDVKDQENIQHEVREENQDESTEIDDPEVAAAEVQVNAIEEKREELE